MSPLAAPTRAIVSATLVLLAVLVPTALAQVPQPSVTVTLEPASIELGAANTTTFEGTVSYADTAPAVPGAGSTDGTITLDITVPDGWSATLEPTTAFPLAPGESAPFTITLVAPDAGAGAQTGAATVTASATSAGGRSAEGSASVGLTRVDPPPPVVPWYQTPAGIGGIIGAVVLVLALIALGVRRRANRLAAEEEAARAAERAAYLDRETGIAIAVPDHPLQYGHKREVVYRASVTNQSQRPRVAVLDVPEITNGWRAGLQVSKVPLAPGETQQVTLVVTPDAVITPGDKATLVLRAKPEEARELSEKVSLDIVAPKHGVPQDPHYKIVSVHREGANKTLQR